MVETRVQRVCLSQCAAISIPPGTRFVAGAAGLGLAALVTAGCVSTGTTTRIAADDLDQLVQEMIQSFAASDFLRQRTAESPAASIVINKVQNLSSDILTEAEQWMIVARVRGAAPIHSFSKTKNITFQITPERHEMLRRAGHGHDLGPVSPPTHLMAATFRSLRRAGRDARQQLTDVRAETYYIEFVIVQIESRHVEWVGQFAFKREAHGLLID